MKKLFAAVAALALCAAAPVYAQVTAGSSASSQVASGAGAVTLGPGAAVGLTGATNTSSSSAQAVRIPFVAGATNTQSTTSGGTFNTHAASGFSLSGSTSQQAGSASAGALSHWPF